MTVAVVAEARRNGQRDAGFVHHFPAAQSPPRPPGSTAGGRSVKQYRNPIALAQEWQRLVSDGTCASRADLARALGVSRARVTQVLGLLDLAPAVVAAVAALGDPLPGPTVSERGLRPLLGLPADEQERALRALMRATAGRRGLRRR